MSATTGTQGCPFQRGESGRTRVVTGAAQWGARTFRADSTGTRSTLVANPLPVADLIRTAADLIG
jgi:hypothetical protein